jgi:hypothetical protein
MYIMRSNVPGSGPQNRSPGARACFAGVAPNRRRVPPRPSLGLPSDDVVRALGAAAVGRPSFVNARARFAQRSLSHRSRRLDQCGAVKSLGAVRRRRAPHTESARPRLVLGRRCDAAERLIPRQPDHGRSWVVGATPPSASYRVSQTTAFPRARPLRSLMEPPGCRSGRSPTLGSDLGRSAPTARALLRSAA